MAVGVELNLRVSWVSAHLLSFPNFIIKHNIEYVSIVNCGKFEWVTVLTLVLEITSMNYPPYGCIRPEACHEHGTFQVRRIVQFHSNSRRKA